MNGCLILKSYIVSKRINGRSDNILTCKEIAVIAVNETFKIKTNYMRQTIYIFYSGYCTALFIESSDVKAYHKNSCLNFVFKKYYYPFGKQIEYSLRPELSVKSSSFYL